ncbi:hypothetical protein [Azospirillum endophyticum]
MPRPVRECCGRRHIPTADPARGRYCTQARVCCQRFGSRLAVSETHPVEEAAAGRAAHGPGSPLAGGAAGKGKPSPVHGQSAVDRVAHCKIAYASICTRDYGASYSHNRFPVNAAIVAFRFGFERNRVGKRCRMLPFL